MDSFWQTRSKSVVLAVVAVLIVGVILAYALPAVKFVGEDFYGDSSSETVGLGDISVALDFYGKGWILDLARIGILAAIVAAIAFPVSQRDAQRWVITAGCAAALILPIYVAYKSGEGESIGIGLILFGLAAIAAAVLAWILPADGPSGSRAPGAMGIVDDGIAIPTWMYRRSPASTETIRPTDPLNIPPTLIVNPASGAPGTPVEVIAERFPVGCAIWLTSKTGISADAVALGTHHASQVGRAHWTYRIPDNAGEGFLQFEANNGHRTATTVFTVIGMTPVG